MKNQKIISNIVLGIAIIGIISIAGYSAWSKKASTNEVLPNSFIMKLQRDSSSSGGNRNYEAVLSFVDNNLVYGRATYHSLGTLGDETNSSCIYKSNQWVDAETGQKCQEYFNSLYSVTKEKLENDIKSGEIKAADGAYCEHGVMCYQLTDDKELLVNYLEPKADIVNWKTYHNDKYGFEFKYPVNVKVELDSHVIPHGTDLVLPSDSKDQENADNRSIIDGSVGNIMSFSIFRESLKDLENFVLTGPAPHGLYTNETIADMPAFSMHYDQDPDDPSRKPTTRIFLQGTNHIFMFDFMDKNSAEGKAILSTFKFTTLADQTSEKSLTISQIENAPMIDWNNLSDCIQPTQLTSGSFKLNCAPGRRYEAVGLDWDSLSIHKDNTRKDEIYFADLNGDGNDDAVAVLDLYGGNKFIGQNLGVWLNYNGNPQPYSIDLLTSDSDLIKSVNINNGIITVNFLYLGRDDTTVKIKFDNGSSEYIK